MRISTPPASTEPATDQLSLSVKDALELPAFRQAMPLVAAGKDGLERNVRWVHAGEVPDMADLLEGGELLLTTGMGLSRKAAEQRKFIIDLAKRGVAGLAIELGRALDELPEAMTSAANSHSFPLIVLRRDVPFVKITEAVHTWILGAKNRQLLFADQLGRQLSQILLDGGGIADVVMFLSSTVENPVFLEDVDGRLLYHAHPDGTDGSVEPWQALKSKTNDADQSAQIVCKLPAAHLGSRGRLVAIALNRSLSFADQVAVEIASEVIAMAMLRGRQEEELHARERGDLLSDLADGLLSGRSARTTAATLGFAPKHSLLVPIAATSSNRAPNAQWGMALRDAHTELESHGLTNLVGVSRSENALLGVVAIASSSTREKAADQCAETIRNAMLKRLGDRDVTVCVGAACDWQAVASNLKATLDGAICAYSLPDRPWHDSHQLELQRLLWHSRDDKYLQDFVNRCLGPLVEHDSERKHSLLPTLEALCAHGGHKAETARALHLNRQALYNRLTRIENLLGADLSNADEMLTLHLACRARGVLDRNGNIT